MPHADFMPTVVFPDTGFGHDAWAEWEKSKVTQPYFCDLYAPDDFTTVKRQCARRDPGGFRANNLCFRCTSGFLFDFHRAVTQTEDERLKV